LEHESHRLPERIKPRVAGVRLIYVSSFVWLAGFITYSAAIGLPTKRSNVILWLLLAIVALGFERPRWTLKTLVFDWSPIIVALGTYDILRGLSENGRTAHTAPQFDFDKWMGGGTIPTVRLQDALHTDGVVRWYDFLGWGIYTTHFLFPLALAVVLWTFRSPRFRPYLWGLALLSWMGLATYYLYPAKPPWMTGREGMHDEVTRIVHSVWKSVGVDRAARVWEPSAKGSASKYSNQVAALPSLHSAFPMYAMLMLRGIRPWLTAIYVVYAVAMGLTLVYAGEHFVFDVFLGWAYAAVAAFTVNFGFRWWRRRHGVTTKDPATDATV